MMMQSRVLLALAIGLLVAADDPKKNSADDDVAAMQGNWVGILGEIEGKKFGENEIQNFKVVVKGKKMTFPGGREGSFELDASKTPKIISLTPLDGPKKGKTQRAIYSIEKDSLKLCLTNSPAVDDPQPAKEFKTKAGDGLTLIVFKREAAAAKSETSDK
jgi:uncharacterized protein (TIGR03067 family)